MYLDDDEENETYKESYEISRSRPRSLKPPNDSPIPRSDPIKASERRRRGRRQQPRRNQNYYEPDESYGDNSNDWIGKSVSSWFTGEEDQPRYDDENYTFRRRQRRKEASDWSPFSVVDAFFGVDRVDMQEKADLYDEKMGLGKPKGPSSRRRQSTTRDVPTRPGYAYRYEENNDDIAPIVDVDVGTEDLAASQVNLGLEKERTADKRIKKRERSWEERSLAVERVPPIGIPAWGPSGKLSLDARTKAIMDALDDIQTAKQKLETKEKKEILAREEITILKV
jgi:hypothetical protein